MELVEDEGNQFCILITDLGEALADLSEVGGAEELVGAQAVLQVLHQLLHPPALVELSSAVVALHAAFKPARAQHARDIAEGRGGGLGVETASSQLVVIAKNFLKGVLGEQNGVLLKSQLLLLFAGEAQLALVESLHLVDEDLVALQLDVLVLGETGGSLPREGVAEGGLLPDVPLVAFDRGDDFFLSALLLLPINAVLRLFLGACLVEKREGSGGMLDGHHVVAV